MLQFMPILSIVFCLAAGLSLTTPQSSQELQTRPAYFYFSDETNLRRVYNSETVDETVVKSVHKKDESIYYLQTRDNTFTPDVLVYNDTNSINKSAFKPTRVTVFLIHGWKGDVKSEINIVLTKALLQTADVNVIVVDWGAIARHNYFTAVASIPALGRHVGQFIKWLTTLGLSYDRVHIIGHSLGAHMAGNAGRETKSKVQRITGLDPAGPHWYTSPDRLTKSDGQYVEAIHTNMACLGYDGVCGDADFFPNGGRTMPDCVRSVCSHSKSYYYMADSIKNNSMYALPCASMDEVKSRTCKGEPYLMGNNDLSKNRSGLFRLDSGVVSETKAILGQICL